MVDISQLNPEQKAQLMAQLEAEKVAEENKKKESRKTLKELSQKAVDEMYLKLTKTSMMLSDVKKLVFDNFESLIALKCELYDVKDEQQSHTFSNCDGTKRITLGYRVMDRYDDTAEVGIAKVREYLDSFAVNTESAKLVSMINSLLRRDSKGNLKANRVLELQKLAAESDSELFKDAVQIIAEAHRPEKSSYFIECDYKGNDEKWLSVALSISSAEFPESDPPAVA